MPNPISDGASADNNQKPKATNLDNLMVRWTRVVGVATGLLVLANLFANFFIFEQWRVASDAQIDTRQQLRAVIGAITSPGVIVNVDKATSTPTSYTVVVGFQNYGSTRTGKFNPWSSIHYFDGAVPNSWDFGKPIAPLPDTVNIVAPGAAYPIPLTLPAADINKAFQKQGEVVTWGHVEYSDVFNPNTSHHVSFCLLLTPTNQSTSGQIVLSATRYREDCNTSD